MFDCRVQWISPRKKPLVSVKEEEKEQKEDLRPKEKGGRLLRRHWGTISE